MSETKHGVAIDRRIVPAPRSVSEQARAMLEHAVQADGIPRNALHIMPDPNDHAAWVRTRTAADAHYAEAIKGLGGSLRAAIRTVHVGDAVIHVATPESGRKGNRAIIDLHGGALVFGAGEACIAGTRMQADLHGVRCYGVDYRVPPEHPFPAALQDCLTAYRHLLDTHTPGNIVVKGRSAGGNLAVAMLMQARAERLPMPAGLVLLSPQVDLSESGDSFQVNRTVDVMLPASLMSSNLLYSGGRDLTDPLLSPLFGDLTGLPATFLQTGTRDLFLSNTVRMHRALRRAGVPAELHVFEAMPHGGFGGSTPEDMELRDEVLRFVEERWRS